MGTQTEYGTDSGPKCRLCGETIWGYSATVLRDYLRCKCYTCGAFMLMEMDTTDKTTINDIKACHAALLRAA